MEEKNVIRINLSTAILFIIIICILVIAFTNIFTISYVKREIKKIDNVKVNVNPVRINNSSTNDEITDSISKLSNRIDNIENRIKENASYESEYSYEIAQYIDFIGKMAIKNNNSNLNERITIQNYMDKEDRIHSEIGTGSNHIVYDVETTSNGTFIAHTVFIEETSRILTDFEIVLKNENGSLVVESCNSI